MELVFLTAAHMVLCFGFVTKSYGECTSILDVAEQYLHSIKTVSFSHSVPAASQLGIHTDWEGT